jgi:hypothetical protein
MSGCDDASAQPIACEASSQIFPEVADALDRHLEQAEYLANANHVARQRHGLLVYALGIPSGALAIAAGSSALARAPVWVTAGIAFLSAGFSAAVAVIRPAQGRAEHDLKEADYANLARAVRRARMTLRSQTRDEQVMALRHIDEERYRLDRTPVKGPAEIG